MFFPNEAVRTLDAAIAGHPKDPRLFSLRATVQIRRQDFAQAVIDSRAARDLAPDEPSFHAGFVQTLLACDRNPAARDEATTALKRFPGHAELYGLRARANLQLGQLDDATADARQLVQLKPTGSWGYLLSAHCCVAAKQYADAALDYQTAVSLVNKDKIERRMSSAAGELSRLLSRCPDAAVRNGAEAMRLAHEVQENGAAVFEQDDILASAFAELGQFDKAVEAQERAVKSAKGGPNFNLFSKRLELYKQGKPCRETKFDH
jgi:tetratricopeptide (TPR) repeat protein